MGCINSTKKLTDCKYENVFRVFLQPDTSSNVRGGCWGYIELTTRELIFTSQGRENIVWQLHYLRRYGVNGDVFSFEAGRRCETGPGIFSFRCDQADRLYQLFQRHVNAVASVTDDAFAFPERNERGLHPSHILGRPADANSNTNNYLEPAPLSMSGIRTSQLHESFSSSPLSLDLDSPDSVPSLSFTNEVVHFQNINPATPGAYASASSNVYLEHPLRAYSIEFNNNATRSICGGSGGGGSSSAFSTLSRKTIAKLPSLDVPPEECAPMLSNSSLLESSHNYANVDNFVGGLNVLRDKDLCNSERCYENLNRADLPLLLQPAPTSRREFQHQCSKDFNNPPETAINYIVLDLDQPRSPTQYSPKTCFGSGSSLAATASGERSDPEVKSLLPAITMSTSLSSGKFIVTTKPELATTSSTSTSTTMKTNSLQRQHTTESTMGYSTIDFIKTCALIKSSTHGAAFAHDEHEESRVAQHNKCVRKAYSISE